MIVARATHQHVRALPAKGDVIIGRRGHTAVATRADELTPIASHHHVVATEGIDVVAVAAPGGDHIAVGGAIERIAHIAPGKRHAPGRTRTVKCQVGIAIGVQQLHALGLGNGRPDGQAKLAVLPTLDIRHRRVLARTHILGRKPPHAIDRAA